jgi:hypothetical protein
MFVLQGLNVRSSTWSSQLMHRVEKSGWLLLTSIHVTNSYLIITANMRSRTPGGLLLTSVHVTSSYWVIWLLQAVGDQVDSAWSKFITFGIGIKWSCNYL